MPVYTEEESDDALPTRMIIAQAITQSAQKSFSWYTRRPGFFVPYKSIFDASIAVTSPFIMPIILGALSIIAGITTLISITVCVGSFLFAKGVNLVGKKEDLAEATMEIVLLSTLASCATAVATILLAVSALVAAPITAVQFLTRTGATVANLLDCYNTVPAEEDSLCI